MIFNRRRTISSNLQTLKWERNIFLLVFRIHNLILCKPQSLGLTVLPCLIHINNNKKSILRCEIFWNCASIPNIMFYSIGSSQKHVLLIFLVHVFSQVLRERTLQISNNDQFLIWYVKTLLNLTYFYNMYPK